MILAAGFGTRMQPLTLTRPKALIEVNGISLLERNIAYLLHFGVTEIVVNVHHFAHQIVDFLSAKKFQNVTIHISDESDAVLETGGGLKRAARFLDGKESFILMNVDILTNLSLGKMINFHQSHQEVLATLAVTDRYSSRALLFDETRQLMGWKNDKTGEKILNTDKEERLVSKAFSGVHVISPRIFDYIEEEGKFSIIDVYLRLARQHVIYGYEHSGDVLLDVGKPESIPFAEAIFL